MKSFKISIVSALFISSALTFSAPVRVEAIGKTPIIEAEPNNEISQANEIPANSVFAENRVKGDLSSTNDVDYYKYVLTREAHGIEVNDVSDNIGSDKNYIPAKNDQLQFTLLDEEGKEVSKSRDEFLIGSSDTSYALLTTDDLKPGTYILKVESKEANGVKSFQGPYEFVSKHFYKFAAPTINDKIYYSTKKITGKAEPGTWITTNASLGSTYVDKNGDFTISLDKLSIVQKVKIKSTQSWSRLRKTGEFPSTSMEVEILDRIYPNSDLEPNDEVSQAIEIPTNSLFAFNRINGDLSSTNDVDYYKYVITRDAHGIEVGDLTGNTEISTDDPSKNHFLQFTLYDEDGKEVSKSHDKPVAKNSDSTFSLLETDELKPGTYILKVESKEVNGSKNYQGSYSFYSNHSYKLVTPTFDNKVYHTAKTITGKTDPDSFLVPMLYNDKGEFYGYLKEVTADENGNFTFEVPKNKLVPGGRISVSVSPPFGLDDALRKTKGDLLWIHTNVPIFDGNEPNDEPDKASPLVQFETKEFLGEISNLDDLDYYTFENTNSYFGVEFSDQTSVPSLNDKVQFSLYNDKGELVKTSEDTSKLYSGRIPKGKYILKVESKTINGEKTYKGAYKIKFKTYYHPEKAPTISNQKLYHNTILKGVSEPNAAVSLDVFDADGKFLRTVNTKFPTNETGEFSIDLQKEKILTGQFVRAHAEYPNVENYVIDSLSYSEKIKVYDGKIPLFKKLDPILDTNPVVSGTVDFPYSTIYVFNGKEKIAEGKSDEKGSFSIQTDFISPKNAGKTITLEIVSPNDVKGDTKELTITPTPVFVTLNPVFDLSSVVSGKVSIPKSRVYVFNGKEKLAEGIANEKGEFSIQTYFISSENVGKTIRLEVVSPEWIKGDTKEVTIEHRVVIWGPLFVTVDPVFDVKPVVSGKVNTPNSTVYVWNWNGEEKIAEGKADAKGNFSIKTDFISPKNAGKTIAVEVVSPDGLRGDTKELTIIRTPVFATLDPVFDVKPVVSGKVSVPNSTVFVFSGKEKIAEGTANAKGEFAIKTSFISPKNVGKTITVYSISPDEVKGETKELKIQKATAPQQPSLYAFGNTMTLISGRTSPNATVSIIKDKKVIGTVKANKDGWFGTNIPKQKAGTILSISAKNEFGLVSKTTTYTVKDMEPPVVYSSTKVTARAINGKVSKPYATVQVFENGKLKHTVKANQYGWFNIYYPAKKKGTTLMIKLKDSSGNVSKDYKYKL